ncbi:MAG TPA: GlsB/YeaQ/YmgE family stress response membrane protein [bacterium]
MGLLWTIIIGLIVGAIAKFLLPGADPGGFLATALIGMGGALLATYIGQFFGFYQAGQGAGFVGSIIGAVLLLLIYRAVVRRR